MKKGTHKCEVPFLPLPFLPEVAAQNFCNFTNKRVFI